MGDYVLTDFVSAHSDLAATINLLDKWISLQQHERHLPGLAAGIVHKGALIWGKGYGFADIEHEKPITLDTRFRIASITKTFTAVAILQLRDAGKLRLDDPVSQYLTWFTLRYEGAPAITIRHLLAHTSGLPRDANIPHWTDDAFQSWDDVVTTTQQRKPTNPPLTVFGYSNLGYTLLGGIVEVVSGEPWAAYIQKHILGPLEMTNTHVTPDKPDEALALGYLRPDKAYVRKAAPFVETKGFSPSASMASSVNDLTKYARFHLSSEDTPILSKHTLREMHQIEWLNKDWLGGYGLGTFIQRINKWTVSGHSGGYKGYITQFMMCREHNTGVIVLTNSLDGTPYEVVERAYKLVLPELLKITKPEPKQAKPEWEKLVGSYTGDWGEVVVMVRDGQLQMAYLRYLDMPPTVLEPTDNPNEFLLKETGEPWETARFETDAAGNVTRLWTRNEYILPKETTE
ncbi:MAG: serine hydrolase [Anaerolineaceae bacterium]|nr:serine hydrolase [Anaerolineaceae bacterium]